MLNDYKFCKNINSKRNIIILSAFTLVFALGVYFRLKGIISRSLEYDEIWTLVNYSSKSLFVIFTELSTPNNHPVNSLFIKVSASILGDNNFAVRLPVFLAGLGVMIFSMLLSLKIFNEKIVAFTVLLLISFNGALVHYSQTARGYELQIFFIVLFLYCIVVTENKKSNNLINCFVVFFLLPIITILTIPTSILFITPFIIFHCIYIFYSLDTVAFSIQEKIKYNYLKRFFTDKRILFYLCFYVVIIAWLLINYSQFRTGQKFGQKVSSIKEILEFAENLIINVITWPVFVLGVLGIFIGRKKYRFISLCAVFAFVFIIFSSVCFKVGPDRVYLILIPCFVIIAVNSLYDILKLIVKNRKLLIVFIVVLTLSWIIYTFPGQLKKWTPPDFKKKYNELCQSLPGNYYICFPAGNGLPASFDNMYGVKQNFSRMPKNEDQYIALYENNNMLEGINAEGGLSFVHLPNKSIKMSIDNKILSIYKIEPLTDKTVIKNKIVFASFPLNDEKRIVYWKSRILKYLTFKNVICVNIWFSRSIISNRSNRKLSGDLLVFDNVNDSVKKLKALEKESDYTVRFYYLDSFF